MRWLTLEDVLSAIIDGNAYINIHTENFRAGEIRGQVEVEDLEFEDRLDPGQEVQDPAVVSDGEGESEFSSGGMAASATPSSGRT